jgi:hypothetical protein
MVLACQGVHVEEEAVCDLLQTDEAGTSLADLDTLLAQSFPQCRVRVESSSLDSLRQSLQEGIPPIVIVNTASLQSYWQRECVHALLVVGIEEQIVFVNDPFFDDAPKQIPVAEFLAAWGVYGQFTIVIVLPKA